jgi:hypothetical protein
VKGRMARSLLVKSSLSRSCSLTWTVLRWGRRPRVKVRMARRCWSSPASLGEMQPHLNSLEVGQEAEGEGEDSQVIVGQVQPLHELKPHHIIWQGADLVVTQVQGPSHKNIYEKVICINSWMLSFHRFPVFIAQNFFLIHLQIVPRRLFLLPYNELATPT